MKTNYLFVYSVDVLQKDGNIDSNLMLLDHEEVRATIADAEKAGDIVIAINVAMYDADGNCIAERDITGFHPQLGN